MSFSLKDSRRNESKTLMFVATSWALASAKFLIAGMTLGPLGQQPPMDVNSYGMATASILLIWLGREWTEKTQGGSNAK